MTVNTPVVPLAGSVVTLAAPSCGSLFKAVTAYTIPRAVIVAAPSLVTLPPNVALFVVMFVLVGAVTVGGAV